MGVAQPTMSRKVNSLKITSASTAEVSLNSNRRVLLHVTPDMTVADVKLLMQEQEGIPPRKNFLVMNPGIELRDDAETLEEVVSRAASAVCRIEVLQHRFPLLFCPY